MLLIHLSTIPASRRRIAKERDGQEDTGLCFNRNTVLRRWESETLNLDEPEVPIKLNQLQYRPAFRVLALRQNEY